MQRIFQLKTCVKNVSLESSNGCKCDGSVEAREANLERVVVLGEQPEGAQRRLQRRVAGAGRSHVIDQC